MEIEDRPECEVCESPTIEVEIALPTDSPEELAEVAYIYVCPIHPPQTPVGSQR